MKTKLLLGVSIIISSISYGQTWGGSTTQTNDAYRQGNVGIGLNGTSPSQSLDLAGNLSIRGTHLVFNSQSGVIDWGGSGIGDLIFRTLSTQGNINGYSEKMIIKNDGSLGLGVSNPAAKLNVVQTSGTAFQIDHNVTTAYSFAQVINVQHDQTKALVIQRITGGTASTVFEIWGNGVVNTKTLYAEAITVTSTAIGTPWPDYVFKKNYNLRTLNELEKYIKANQHLPNVPSAQDIAKKGMNVMEMNKVLLEKVEELSLYIIELKKEIDAIKIKIK